MLAHLPLLLATLANRERIIMKRISVIISILILISAQQHVYGHKRFPSDTPITVKKIILELESMVGIYTAPDGIRFLKLPYQEKNVEALIQNLDHSYPLVQATAWELLYLLLRDVEVPNEIIEKKIVPEIGDSVEKYSDSSIVPLVNRANWILDIRKSLGKYRFLLLEESLFNSSANKWLLALESIDLLVREANEKAKQLLLRRLDEESNMKSDFSRRLRIGIRKIEIMQMLAFEKPNEQKVNIAKKTILELSEKKEDESLVFFLIWQLAKIGSDESKALIMQISESSSYSVNIRGVARDVLEGLSKS